MDPILPNNQPTTNQPAQPLQPNSVQNPPSSSPALNPQDVPATAGRSKEMEAVAMPTTPITEKTENVRQVEKVFSEKGPSAQTEKLELSKEILPGVEEVHDHQTDPIKLPSLLSDSGLTSVPLPPGALMQKDTTVVLPLSQGQIKQGLHQSVTKSVRWMAEWCVKQLKEAHRISKNRREQQLR